MVVLPNAKRLEIPREKVVDYLLSTTHSVGRFKAAFFTQLGFTSEKPLELIDALSRLAHANDAIPAERNSFGQKYTVRGIVTGPEGQSAVLETVWIVLNSESHPRFVTAYPGS